MELDKRAFELFWDMERFDRSDVDSDGCFTPFENYKRTVHLMRITDYKLPKKVYIEAFFDELADTDYPVTDLNWPIMSKKMYEVLKSCGNFEHKIIPVTMINNTIPPKDRFDSNGNLNPSVGDTNFIAIQLTSYADIFDYENSIYEPHEIFPEKVGYIKKLILKANPEEIPPVFRLKECSTSIFVSAYTKETLEKAGIKGVVYNLLENL